MTELIERLADVQHEIWSHWMSHVFGECGQLTEDGAFVITAEHVASLVSGQRYRLTLDDGRTGEFLVRRNTSAGETNRAVSIKGTSTLK